MRIDMSPRIILGQKFYTSVCTAVVENKLGHIVVEKKNRLTFSNNIYYNFFMFLLSYSICCFLKLWIGKCDYEFDYCFKTLIRPKTAPLDDGWIHARKNPSYTCSSTYNTYTSIIYIYMRLYKRQAARIQGYFWKLKDFSGVIWIHLTQWKKVRIAEKE